MVKKLDILIYPDPRLRNIAQPVEVFDDELKAFVHDMLHTMYASKGIGLAATQVNVAKQIIVMDITEDRSHPRVYINPTFETKEGTTTYEEGCLSVPGFFDNVERAETVVVSAYNINGKRFTKKLDGLLSICLQHEYDHLQGKVFVDYLSRLKQDRVKHKLEKEVKAGMHKRRAPRVA